MTPIGNISQVLRVQPTRLIVDEVPLALLLKFNVVGGEFVAGAVAVAPPAAVVEGDAVGRALLGDGSRLTAHRQLLYLALQEEKRANAFKF